MSSRNQIENQIDRKNSEQRNFEILKLPTYIEELFILEVNTSLTGYDIMKKKS